MAGRQRNDGNGLDSVTRTSGNRSSDEAASVRDRLAEYFMSPGGEVEWQWNHVSNAGLNT